MRAMIQRTRKEIYQLAYAAGTDTANRNMHKHSRKAWNKEDYSIAAWETNRIIDRLLGA